MGNSYMGEKELISALHDLPRSISPQRDLWPGILQRLKPGPAQAGTGGRPAWRARAIAASLGVAFVSGILLGRQLPRQDALSGDSAGIPAGITLLATLEASEREYRAAFREFIPVGVARSLLASDAVENIEHSWWQLKQAETALLSALEEHPGNMYLNEKLLDLRAQQLEFMRQLAMLDQTSRRKI